MENSYVNMYSKVPAYILGFHGCSKKTYEEIIYKNGTLKKSTNRYDWLGPGIYFWENNYQRALEWAKSHYGEDGSVIGAIIDLGYCLDLNDSRSVPIIKQGYEILKTLCDNTGTPMPENKKGNSKTDVLIRDLDCAVIQTIHDYNVKHDLLKYDSVRGIFEEGKEMYPGAGFKEKTHTQVCIINPNCIKGFFTPRKKNSQYVLP